MVQEQRHFTKGSNLDTHRCKSFQPQKTLKQKEVKWIIKINAHYDRLIPPTWEYYYYYSFGSISDKHLQTRKQGLLTQHHVTVRETLWNICVFSCSQDNSVSVVSATGWTTEEPHLYSRQAWVFSSSKCPGQLQGPSSLLFNGYCEFSEQGIQLIIHLHMHSWSSQTS